MLCVAIVATASAMRTQLPSLGRVMTGRLTAGATRKAWLIKLEVQPATNWSS